MAFLIKLAGAAVLVACLALGLVVWDLGWNGGALLARLSGRDALVRDCTPPLQRKLAQEGFTPVDLAFGDISAFGAVSGSFGRSRSLASAFTFTDGDDGPRIDGRFVCTVGQTVTIQVEVDQLPRRVT
jgi:hypothetical protein